MATKKATKKRATRKVAKGKASDLPRRPPRFFPLGVPGLKRKGGEVDDEWLPELRGKKGAKVYREMSSNDPIIGAYLWIVELLTRQTPYTIEPSGNTPEAEEAAVFAQECVDDMRGGMPAFMSEFLTALAYGWAVMEKVFKIRRGPEYRLPQLHSKYRDGRIGIRRIGLIAQESLHEWIFSDDADGEAVAMVQMPPPPDSGLRTIPLEKTLLVRFRQRLDNPEGTSVLRTAYTSYYFKKNFSFVEAVGIERYLAGLPVMQLPRDLLESDEAEDKAIVNEYKDLVRKIKVDEYQGVVIPSEDDADGKTGFRLGAFNAGGSKPMDVDPVIRRLDARIAMTMIAEFLVVGIDKVGSLALHGDKTALFAVALGAILDERDRLFNEEVFPELMRLNGKPVEVSPLMRHGDVEKVDMTALASALQAITGSGVVTVDDRLEDWTRKRLGLPERDDTTTRTPTQLPLPMETEL